MRRLADQGRYLASESSFYRILRAQLSSTGVAGASHRVMCRYQPAIPRLGPIKCGPAAHHQAVCCRELKTLF